MKRGDCMTQGFTEGFVHARHRAIRAEHGHKFKFLAGVYPPMTKIDRFEGEYRFLSNFFIEPDGTHVEGEYQAAKCANASDAVMFLELSPASAKRFGKTVKLRKDWEDVKVPVMRKLVLSKFDDSLELAQRLIATGDAELVEGNWWGDTFWGVCRGEGRNELGKILMDVREIMKKKKIDLEPWPDYPG